MVNNLTLGKAYFFRVAPENAVGIGPFRETACEIIIREHLSMLFYLSFIYHIIKKVVYQKYRRTFVKLCFFYVCKVHQTVPRMLKSLLSLKTILI